MGRCCWRWERAWWGGGRGGVEGGSVGLCMVGLGGEGGWVSCAGCVVGVEIVT